MSFERFVGIDQLSLRDDGRSVEGRIVPYGEVVDITEEIDGKLERYQEQFMPGSLARLAQVTQKRGNAAFIPLLLDHDEANFDSRVGYATSIRSEDDGAYATFRLYESRDLPKIQSMLGSSHTGLSVKFGDVVPPKTIGGVVSRVQVLVSHVAATPVPAYSGASIMALRSTGDPVGANEGLPRPALADVQAWLATQREGKQ